MNDEKSTVSVFVFRSRIWPAAKLDTRTRENKRERDYLLEQPLYLYNVLVSCVTRGIPRACSYRIYRDFVLENLGRISSSNEKSIHYRV